MKILLFGGSGTLGKELLLINSNIISPSSKDCDIFNYENVDKCVDDYNPDIVINAAAIVDNRIITDNPESAIKVNIIGSANIALVCKRKKIRYVFISTDYIYEGTTGNYSEGDSIKPFNKYAWTKLAGECSANCLCDSLIIRTSFGKIKFEYENAFVDKFTSKDYVDIIAPMILEASLSDITGTLNIGTEKKTVYDYAMSRSVVNPIKISTNDYTPVDTSLNTDKWNNYKNNQ